MSSTACVNVLHCPPITTLCTWLISQKILISHPTDLSTIRRNSKISSTNSFRPRCLCARRWKPGREGDKERGRGAGQGRDQRGDVPQPALFRVTFDDLPSHAKPACPTRAPFSPKIRRSRCPRDPSPPTTSRSPRGARQQVSPPRRRARANFTVLPGTPYRRCAILP